MRVPAPRIHPTAEIEPGAAIGPETAVWDHVHVRSGAVVGRGCIVGEKTYVAYGVTIGDLVKINAGAYLCAGTVVEDGCLIAAHVVLTNERVPRATDRDIRRLCPSEPTARTLRTRVCRGASIGANATIGPGLTLGAWCMVGMGAVVTCDVPAHGLVAGNPARLLGLVARDGTKVLHLAPGQALPAAARIDCPGDGWLEVDAAGVRHVAG